MSFNILVLYGLTSDQMQQDFIIKIVCFVFPILGAVSFMRFMSNGKNEL